MSKFALETQDKERTVEFKYRGLVFLLSAVPDLRYWRKVLQEQIVASGGDPKLLEKSPEEGGADVDTVTRWLGRAMGATFVKGVFTRDEDGNIQPFVVNGVPFNFNAPSELDYFSTQGEELIGHNPVMQDALWNEASRLAKTPPDYEVSALKKSLAALDSGDELIQLG